MVKGEATKIQFRKKCVLSQLCVNVFVNDHGCVGQEKRQTLDSHIYQYYDMSLWKNVRTGSKWNKRRGLSKGKKQIAYGNI